MSGRELLSSRVHLYRDNCSLQPCQAEDYPQWNPERNVRALSRRQRDQDHQHREVGSPQVTLKIVSSIHCSIGYIVGVCCIKIRDKYVTQGKSWYHKDKLNLHNIPFLMWSSLGSRHLSTTFSGLYSNNYHKYFMLFSRGVDQCLGVNQHLGVTPIS